MNNESNGKKKKKVGRIIVIAIATVLVQLIIIFPINALIIYESVFAASTHNAKEWLELDYKDYDGLIRTESNVTDDDQQTLIGYYYSSQELEPKGVAIVSHGMGGNGHTEYMPIIAEFVKGGYLVFAYDSAGSGETGGFTAEGFPEGIIELERAIAHVTSNEKSASLPIVLFGHSWGGYSVANVLNFCPEISAAVIVAGFNQSEDMLLYSSRRYIGIVADLFKGYMFNYERMKFGSRYTDITAVEGMKNTDAGIMIVYSTDDTTVPYDSAYSVFYEEFADNERFEFVLCTDRGHVYPLYSDGASQYRLGINEQYRKYLTESGRRDSTSAEDEYLLQNIDRELYFEVDRELMDRIINLFDKYCAE